MASKRFTAISGALLALAIAAVVIGCEASAEPNDASLKHRSDGMEQSANTYLTHERNGYFEGRGSVTDSSRKLEARIADTRLEWVVGSESSGGRVQLGVIDGDGRAAVLDGLTNFTHEISWVESGLRGQADAPGFDGAAPSELRLVENAELSRRSTELRASLDEFSNSPDGASVVGSDGWVFSYSSPTDRYPHGALGDDFEWGAIVGISVGSAAETVIYELGDDEVFEGRFPLVADVDGDGSEEIVTTVSNPANGARLVVFKLVDGERLELVAQSDPVGTGFRWLHQITVAPFGPNGEIEISVVQTPHVGGIAKFYRLVNQELVLAASEAGGYMSHVNGSRVLDQAVAGDFDGDGQVEMVVPSRDQESLIGLRRIGDSVHEVWELELGARLSSNVMAKTLGNGALVLAAGTTDGTLHIWP